MVMLDSRERCVARDAKRSLQLRAAMVAFKPKDLACFRLSIVMYVFLRIRNPYKNNLFSAYFSPKEKNGMAG